MALLENQDFILVKYSVLDASLTWYQEKLGCRKATEEEFEMNEGDEPPDAMMMLGDGPLLFCKSGDGFPATVPIINTHKIEAAFELLSGRGVSCAPIQRDRDGASFFEIRDLDGNVIEITQSP